MTKCGTAPQPKENPVASACFNNAVNHNTPAEIHFTNHTTEGDLIESWVQFLTRSSSRLYLHSNDRFGDRGWSWCSGPIMKTPTGWNVQCQPQKIR